MNRYDITRHLQFLPNSIRVSAPVISHHRLHGDTLGNRPLSKMSLLRQFQDVACQYGHTFQELSVLSCGVA